MGLQEYDVKVTKTGHFTVMAYSEKDAYEKLNDMDADEWDKQARWEETELEDVY